MTATLEITAIGSSCSIPRPGRACSSYLVEHEDAGVLFDLGTGAFANLRMHRMPDTLDAIVVTHLHTDHFLDLVPLRYALRYGTRTREGRIPLYLPPGGIAMCERLAEAVSRESGDFFHDVYDMREYDAAAEVRIGEARVTFAPTTHYIAAFALRYELGGTAVVYSADTAFDERVIALARDCDLFVCESTLGPEGVESGERGHASAIDAGEMATRANARRLVLTHYGAECDGEALVHAARRRFEGPIELADDHRRWSVAPARVCPP